MGQITRKVIIAVAFLPSLFAQYSPPSGGGAPTGAAGGSLSGTYPNPGLSSPLVLTGPIQATGFTGDGTKSGSLTLGGVTSGAAGFAVNDIAGTAILYLLPAANGAVGQAMYDTGSATCPTLAAGAPATCHQMAWTSPAFAAQTDSATVTWAIGGSPLANASLTFTAHGGSRTLNLTGLVNGGSYVLRLKQDGTGGEGLTLGTGCTWLVGGGGSGAITPSTGASAVDVLAFTYDGTNCYANFRTNFN